MSAEVQEPRAVQVMTARIALAWNELREIDRTAAEDLAKALASGSLVYGPRREITAWSEQ